MGAPGKTLLKHCASSMSPSNQTHTRTLHQIYAAPFNQAFSPSGAPACAPALPNIHGRVMKLYVWYQLTENAHSPNSHYSTVTTIYNPAWAPRPSLRFGSIGTTQHCVDLQDHQWIFVTFPVPWHWRCVILVNRRAGTAEKCTPVSPFLGLVFI